MKRKRFRKLPFLILLAFAVFAFYGYLQNDPDAKDKVSSFVQQENPYVKMVKGATNSRFPGVSYGDAFSAFFGEPTWRYFCADTGEDVVEFTGNCSYQDLPVKARLQFIVDEARDTFETGSLSFNEEPQNQFITATLMSKVFVSYYEEHGYTIPEEVSS